jgi:aspartyl-tRNA(Asn)/glutamyl-tRNA(Gln) amidotransferase subunit B
MPVLNREALDLALRAALAIEADIAPETSWDRKQYFYPDLTKGYQISQLRQPVCRGGSVGFDPGERIDPVQPVRVPISHAHLEEDAGKSIHEGPGIPAGRTALDFNRAGTPLLEIVTRPVLQNGRQARLFLTELRNLLVWNGITDGNMQEGSLRCDANVNVELATSGGAVRTPVVEIKNLNSLRAVERAVDFESARQQAELEARGAQPLPGGKQTRGWDDLRGITVIQREKELAADYRYLPEPDLPPVGIDEPTLDRLRQQLVASPARTRSRLREQWGLSFQDARVITSHSRCAVDWLERVATACGDGKLAANWLQQVVFAHLADHQLALEDYPVSTEETAKLLAAVAQQGLSTTRAREVLARMLQTGESTQSAMTAMNIQATAAEVTGPAIDAVLAAQAEAVRDYRAGKAAALGPLIAAVRRAVPDADPAHIREQIIGRIRENSGD